MNREQCADYAYHFLHSRMKIVVAMVTEIVKMLHRYRTYVLQETPVFVDRYHGGYFYILHSSPI